MLDSVSISIASIHFISFRFYCPTFSPKQFGLQHFTCTPWTIGSDLCANSFGLELDCEAILHVSERQIDHWLAFMPSVRLIASELTIAATENARCTPCFAYALNAHTTASNFCSNRTMKTKQYFDWTNDILYTWTHRTWRDMWSKS